MAANNDKHITMDLDKMKNLETNMNSKMATLARNISNYDKAFKKLAIGEDGVAYWSGVNAKKWAELSFTDMIYIAANYERAYNALNAFANYYDKQKTANGGDR